MEIKSKNDIIDYFASGIKQDELIGVENEQFLFNIKTNKRAEYENIKKLLQIFITKFGWQEIKEQHKESKTFKAGNKLVTANLPWGKIGFTICFDLRFPELYRNLSKKNLSFIAVPSAFTKFTGQKHWLTLLRARAIENFCYIFAPAQTGKNTPKRETFGHTAIISPDGKILALKKLGKGVIYSKINPKLSMDLRKIIPSLI